MTRLLDCILSVLLHAWVVDQLGLRYDRIMKANNRPLKRGRESAEDWEIEMNKGKNSAKWKNVQPETWNSSVSFTKGRPDQLRTTSADKHTDPDKTYKIHTQHSYFLTSPTWITRREIITVNCTIRCHQGEGRFPCESGSSQRLMFRVVTFSCSKHVMFHAGFDCFVKVNML